MRLTVKHIWHIGREYLSHWMVAGAILAATGAAPEHWLADLFSDVHLPAGALHLWAAQIDLRMVLAGLGLTLVVGDIAWRRTRPPARTMVAAAPADVIPGAPPLPDKPSIAVLAFDNLSGDPEQEYFSDGIAEDIITELSRTRWLFVIARNSTFTYKGRATDVKQVARELGVRYVLEGSVRRSGERVRITAQLIDAATGNHVWAERYDRDRADVFAVQDEITTTVTHAIAPAIAQAERQRALRKLPENLDAWEAYQRGLSHLGQGSREDIERAQQFFRRATELDPLFATPRAMLAFTYVNSIVYRNVRGVSESLKLAEAEARRAIALDPDESSALAVLSWVAFNDANYAAALELADHALAANPNDVSAYLTKGRTLEFAGRLREAEEALLLALRLSPRDPLSAFVLMQLSVAYYFGRRYADAVSAAQRAIRETPEFPMSYRWLAASLGQLGRTEEARDALQRALAMSPEAFDYFVRHRQAYYRKEDYQHMLDGLRKAGWPG